MKFTAIVYDTINGNPMHIKVRNINVQHKTVVGHNGMRYRDFKLFHVKDGEEALIEEIGETDAQT